MASHTSGRRCIFKTAGNKKNIIYHKMKLNCSRCYVVCMHFYEFYECNSTFLFSNGVSHTLDSVNSYFLFSMKKSCA